jgi:hypothetical protein
MTQQQLIELVQQHHPNMRETEIRLYLNRALIDFCKQTRIMSGTSVISTIADQRYYDLAETVLEVTRVDCDDYQINRLIGRPEKTDVS